MSLTAYQKTLKATEHPRDVEYRLFGQVTRALLEAAPLPRTDPKKIAAIDWNRRVWSTMAGDCSSDANAMPPQIRAGIISLSLFVARYSSQVMASAMPIDPLIEINRTIMQGLAARPTASAA
ncbi:MAG: flagellar biosynthesis regulator FlaF [Alphaproteobacteria bacterium]|nr:flagellar biosynthesis regulator FlaF [Alphaproteobacteria bacterium]